MSALLLFWLRSAVPTATVLLIMLATAATSPLLAAWSGCGGLIAIHFWSVPQRIAMPSAVVFALGLLQDAILATPFGTHACLWLLVYTLGVYSAFLPDKTRRLSLTLHFAIVSMFFPIGATALLLVQNQSLGNLLGLLLGWVLCVAAYPLIVRMLQPLEQKLLQ